MVRTRHITWNWRTNEALEHPGEALLFLRSLLVRVIMSKYRALTQIFPSSFTAHTSAKILQKHKYWKKSGTSKKFQDAVDLMIKFLQKHLYTLHGRSSQGGNQDTLDITGASSGNRLGSDTTRLASCGVIPFSHSENMTARVFGRTPYLSGQRDVLFCWGALPQSSTTLWPPSASAVRGRRFHTRLQISLALRAFSDLTLLCFICNSRGCYEALWFTCYMFFWLGCSSLHYTILLLLLLLLLDSCISRHW